MSSLEAVADLLNLPPAEPFCRQGESRVRDRVPHQVLHEPWRSGRLGAKEASVPQHCAGLLLAVLQPQGGVRVVPLPRHQGGALRPGRKREQRLRATLQLSNYRCRYMQQDWVDLQPLCHVTVVYQRQEAREGALGVRVGGIQRHSSQLRHPGGLQERPSAGTSGTTPYGHQGVKCRCTYS